ncbi:hypothetical protein DLAC_05594 [Tieghemostelium lacteum]|uniref:MACPF domain-containing protein n=1 Tax=Tieghemostelium lacteum TaxID=361077 RepID=A0A151ZGI8_TIELA|nr:hypothetical protein DLAC_05594 [Tieghemostelium lacteum]|eukprot:KYQ92990.1 hypothetical protein DLAC_05594 [Tieghemostelium lacteum]
MAILLELKDSKLYLSGITVMNCMELNGGVIYSQNSSLTINNVNFYNNKAQIGGVLYLSSSMLYGKNNSMIGNTALVSGSSIYSDNSFGGALKGWSVLCNLASSDISVRGTSNLMFEKSNIPTTTGIDCLGTGAKVSHDYSSICSRLPGTCTTVPTLKVPVEVSSILTSYQCNFDQVCDPSTESCLSCPDCKSCKFSGSKLELFQSNNLSQPYSVSSLDGFSISNFFAPYQVFGKITGFFEVDTNSIYQLIVNGKNIGFSLYLNNVKLLDMMNVQVETSGHYTSRIQSKVVNVLKLEFLTSTLNLQAGFTVSLKRVGDDQTDILSTFYSQNYCNDGIKSDGEVCSYDQNGTRVDQAVCGDGICNERVFEDCLYDCYDNLGTNCPAQVQPIKSNFASKDTYSVLLDNQYKQSLPGLNHLSHGIDLLTGEELPSVIFDFGYCSNYTYSTIQNTYRGAVYNVPPEFYGELSPKCSFDMQSKVYQSSYEYTTEKSKEIDFSATSSAGGGNLAVQVSVSASYSQSDSSRQARSLSNTREGKVISTNVKCLTSKVTRNSIRFHSSFIKEISRVTTPMEMSRFIKKFGSLYYLSASLGGSLEQLTIASKTISSSKSEDELRIASSMSFSASVSSPYASGSASYSESLDTQTTVSQQQDFELESSRSTIITKGGQGGSFGPDYDSPSTFSDWSNTVDLLPVPVEYKLALIGGIIPTSWKVFGSNTTIKELWFKGYDYYLNDSLSLTEDMNDYYNITIFFRSPFYNNYYTQQAERWSNITVNMTMGGTPPTKLTYYNVNIGSFLPNNTNPYIIEIRLPRNSTFREIKTLDFLDPSTNYKPQDFLMSMAIISERQTGRGYNIQYPLDGIGPFVPLYQHAQETIVVPIEVNLIEIGNQFRNSQNDLYFPSLVIITYGYNGTNVYEFNLADYFSITYTSSSEFTVSSNFTVLKTTVPMYSDYIYDTTILLQWDSPMGAALRGSFSQIAKLFTFPSEILIIQDCPNPTLEDPRYGSCVPLNAIENAINLPGYSNLFKPTSFPYPTFPFLIDNKSTIKMTYYK